MRTVRKYTVTPALPEKLEPLRTLAYNLWWCWSHEAVSLFRRMDRDLWERVGHNPIQVLGSIPQERLNEIAEDEGFISHLERVVNHSKQYNNATTWFHKAYTDEKEPLIAYFSAEYGINESLPVYSGGLGVLSGDHLKASSDLGIPLVAIGLLYRMGYFKQYLNIDGWQQEKYQENDWYNLPLTAVMNPENKPLFISVEILGRPVAARIWCLKVGRIPLYLLDTNVKQNHPDDREITAHLYGGDLEMRIKQEMMLGIGGQKALEALGLNTTVHHMNEGHSAFQALEQIRRTMIKRNLNFHEARLATMGNNVFTTHTPVPAGNDMFPPKLIDKYLGHYWPSLGLHRNEFLALGRIHPKDHNEHFCMTVLALKLAGHNNGVSKIHGMVSRNMWKDCWPGLPEAETPIQSITNGIHMSSMISRDMALLFDRYLGHKWHFFDDKNTKVWESVDKIPDEELWRTHERLRERLVVFSRQRLQKQLVQRGALETQVRAATEVLDPEALTIGFARRFATYKRATLLFSEVERLKKLLSNPTKPVQLIIAGKAHPQDNEGKDLIRQIIHHVRDPILRSHIVFLENYDIHVARTMVQGVDIWLNTPRKPLEASGTSGMKVGPNGGINLSIPDGWWPEAAQRDNGWSIGHGEEYEDADYQDKVECNALFDLLEKEIVPLFYNRSENDLPKKWVARMKASIKTICPQFNTSRMVSEYTDRFYVPAHRKFMKAKQEDYKMAKSLAGWEEKIKHHWHHMAIKSVETGSMDALKVGDSLKVHVWIQLNELSPEDIKVELYYGALDSHHEYIQGETMQMKFMDISEYGDHHYEGAIPCNTSGRQGFSIRILPCHPDMVTPVIPGYIQWG